MGSSNGAIQKTFDYASLDQETAVAVENNAYEIRQRIKIAARNICEIGEILIDAKRRLGHGRFLEWLEAEFDWSDRTARRYMSVAEAFKSDTVSDLDFAPRALYMLASPSVPEEARQEAIERAQSGEKIGEPEARESIARHTPAPRLTRPSKVEDDCPAYEDESQEAPEPAEKMADVVADADEPGEQLDHRLPDRVGTRDPGFPSRLNPRIDEAEIVNPAESPVVAEDEAAPESVPFAAILAREPDPEDDADSREERAARFERQVNQLRGYAAVLDEIADHDRAHFRWRKAERRRLAVSLTLIRDKFDAAIRYLEA